MLKNKVVSCFSDVYGGRNKLRTASTPITVKISTRMRSTTDPPCMAVVARLTMDFMVSRAVVHIESDAAFPPSSGLRFVLGIRKTASLKY
jgi:hypothetical protein